MATTGPALTRAFEVHAHLRTALAEIATPLSRSKGCFLFKQGDAARGVFLLHKGRVRLSLEAHGSRRLLSRTVGPRSLLGVPASICDGPYSLTAEILEDSELGFVTQKDLRAFLLSNSHLCFHVVEMLGREVREIRHMLANSLKPPLTRTRRISH